jgi:C-5 cytosine-specific DNA methylase
MALRLLDLFCGAGGAGMGYFEAGFEVTGVDHQPQPNYPFEFRQADALTFPLDGFDVIHASPPCQHYSRATAWRGDRNNHPDLLGVVIARLTAHGAPFVVETVPLAPMLPDLVLCGSMFGLRVRRHRLFMVRPQIATLTSPCNHSLPIIPFGHKHERAFADAMECDWMTAQEGREAIPPAYTRHIGELILSDLLEPV